jgi:hypothetical protein
MSSKLNVVLAVSCFAGLTACGPGAKMAPGKDSAAQALYGASGAASKGQDPYGQPIDFSLSATYNCREGGTAKLSGFQAVTDFTGGGVSVGQGFDIAYNNCGAVKTRYGVAILNGTWNVTQGVVTGTSSVNVQQSFKGKILYQGAMDDYLDADITQTVAVAATEQTGGSVSMVLVGSLANSSGTYTYDESVSVTAGDIDVQVSSSSAQNP